MTETRLGYVAKGEYVPLSKTFYYTITRPDGTEYNHITGDSWGPVTDIYVWGWERRVRKHMRKKLRYVARLDHAIANPKTLRETL